MESAAKQGERAGLADHAARYLTFERTPGAIPELDGLRAFAILLVLGRHGLTPFWTAEAGLFPVAGWDLATPILNGWVGVDLFFVLSGFLIASHIMRRWDDRRGRPVLRAYFVKRALRIVPAYYAVLLIAALGWIPGYAVAQDFILGRVAYHALFLQDYLPANIVVAFWSLGVEEKFYLVAPFLLLGILRLPRPAWRYAALGGLILLPSTLRWLTHLGTPNEVSYVEFFTTFRSPFHVCFDGLMVGVLCALLHRDRASLTCLADKRWARLLFWAGLATLGVLLLRAPLVDLGAGLFEKTVLQAVIALCFGAILLGAVQGGGPSGLLSRPWLMVLARISYSLYLVHMTVIPGVRALLEVALGLEHLAPGLQALVFFPVYAVASLAFAFLLHFVVEKPFLLLKDRRRPSHPIRAAAAARG